MLQQAANQGVSGLYIRTGKPPITAFIGGRNKLPSQEGLFDQENRENIYESFILGGCYVYSIVSEALFNEVFPEFGVINGKQVTRMDLIPKNIVIID